MILVINSQKGVILLPLSRRLHFSWCLTVCLYICVFVFLCLSGKITQKVLHGFGWNSRTSILAQWTNDWILVVILKTEDRRKPNLYWVSHPISPWLKSALSECFSVFFPFKFNSPNSPTFNIPHSRGVYFVLCFWRQLDCKHKKVYGYFNG